MFFKNKNEKILSEVINRNYAVIYFKPDGTVIKANEVFLKTMGYSLEEVAGKHHSMFCEEKFTKTQEYKDGWNDVREGKTLTAEFQRVKKDSSIHTYTYSAITKDLKGQELVNFKELSTGDTAASA